MTREDIISALIEAAEFVQGVKVTEKGLEPLLEDKAVFMVLAEFARVIEKRVKNENSSKT